MVVARVIKPKFVRKDRSAGDGIVMGDTPELPIPRGLAGPVCWQTRSFVAGKTICRCTDSRASTRERESSSHVRLLERPREDLSVGRIRGFDSLRLHHVCSGIAGRGSGAGGYCFTSWIQSR
jgi:hypothetical protein